MRSLGSSIAQHMLFAEARYLDATLMGFVRSFDGSTLHLDDERFVSVTRTALSRVIYPHRRCPPAYAQELCTSRPLPASCTCAKYQVDIAICMLHLTVYGVFALNSTLQSDNSHPPLAYRGVSQQYSRVSALSYSCRSCKQFKGIKCLALFECHQCSYESYEQSTELTTRKLSSCRSKMLGFQD